MKHLRLWITLGVCTLLAAGPIASLRAQDNGNQGNQGFQGASYITTVKDSNGSFASRGVIALHADHTMSVIDSGQGGPTFFFSNQLGSWKPGTTGGLIARTIDFDFPPNAAIARADYTITIAPDGKTISGTITLTTFSLQANPLDGGGTVVGTFTFTGALITPS